MSKETEPEMKPEEPKQEGSTLETEPYEMPLWAEAARKIGWTEELIIWAAEREREHWGEGGEQSC